MKWLRQTFQQVNLSPLVFALALSLLGLITLYSASYGTAHKWASRQTLHIALSLIPLILITKIELRHFKHYAYPIYGVCLALLLAVEVGGHIGMGAQRWINLGFMKLQPSELMKIGLLLALARFYCHLSLKEVKRFENLLPPLLLIAMPTALVLKQPDLGTALLLLMSSAGIMLLAGVPLYYFLVAGGVMVAFVPLIKSHLHDYQLKRIEIFLNPELDPLGKGYHVMQSKIALGSGGFWGKGYLQGTQAHLDFLPEKHTDFIFTMFGEEFGFVGAFILIVLFGFFLLSCFRTAFQAKTSFGKLLSFSLALLVFFYVFVNIAMVAGMLPVVGVPLPFVSYGGTSMISLFIIVGFVLASSKEKKRRSNFE